MKTTDTLTLVPIDKLVPYANNARTHSQWQIAKIRASLREFGFINPIIIDADYNVIAGHGRLEAARAEGMEEVPCVFADHLTEAQKKAYILADNRMALDAGWDAELLKVELEGLDGLGFDLDLTGFGRDDVDAILGGEAAKAAAWFGDADRDMGGKQEGNDEYNSFVEKFEEKHTTDDCYTPDAVYEAVASFVERRYGIGRDRFVRPFYPGGDYAKFEYAPDAVVVDNPPFSIETEIVRLYCSRGIKFFLFCPALAPTRAALRCGGTLISMGVTVTYENGAVVSTSFVTNIDPSDPSIMSCPELYEAIKKADDEAKGAKAEVHSYSYPDNVVTPTMAAKFSKYGVPFSVPKGKWKRISALDEQKELGLVIFDFGLLVADDVAAAKAAAEKAAEKAAAEKAAAKAADKVSAEKAAAEKAIAFKLTPRERAIVDGLNGGDGA